jgi:hypothetical protein
MLAGSIQLTAHKGKPRQARLAVDAARFSLRQLVEGGGGFLVITKLKQRITQDSE